MVCVPELRGKQRKQESGWTTRWLAWLVPGGKLFAGEAIGSVVCLLVMIQIRKNGSASVPRSTYSVDRRFGAHQVRGQWHVFGRDADDVVQIECGSEVLIIEVLAGQCLHDRVRPNSRCRWPCIKPVYLATHGRRRHARKSEKNAARTSGYRTYCRLRWRRGFGLPDARATTVSPQATAV